MFKRFGGPVTQWEDYVRLFRGVRGEIAIGEASVCYLWSETAVRLIAARFPEAKILMVLRDPADRAFSHYLAALSSGLTRSTFRDYVEADLKCQTAECTLTHPFLAFGSYYEQVKRYQELFQERNIRIFLYEDYKRDPHAFLRQIFEFLSVDPGYSPDMTRRYLEPRIPRFPATRGCLTNSGVWQRARETVPPIVRRALRPVLFRRRASLRLEPADRALLVQYYRDDIIKCARLLNRDLSYWLTA